MYDKHITQVSAHMSAAALMSGGTTAIGQPAPSSQGETNLIQLSHNIEQLEAEVQALISRINQVLRPSYGPQGVSGGVGEKTMPEHCALAGTFLSLSRSVENIRGQIGDAISRVDI